jgi:hypothetical protein
MTLTAGASHNHRGRFTPSREGGITAFEASRERLAFRRYLGYAV